MDREKVLKEFRAADALLEGHFILSSGLRSSIYLQCARVMMNPKRGARLCKALAAKIAAEVKKPIDLVVAPAMGGVVVGYEMGRQLKVDTIFMERVDGTFQLRRGFEIPAGANVLMMEDVVTTGLSSRECIEAIKAHGGKVVAAASLVDRSGGEARVGVKLISLLKLKAPTYEADKVPASLKKIEAIKPGSRGLKA